MKRIAGVPAPRGPETVRLLPAPIGTDRPAKPFTLRAPTTAKARLAGRTRFRPLFPAAFLAQLCRQDDGVEARRAQRRERARLAADAYAKAPRGSASAEPRHVASV